MDKCVIRYFDFSLLWNLFLDMANRRIICYVEANSFTRLHAHDINIKINTTVFDMLADVHLTTFTFFNNNYTFGMISNTKYENKLQICVKSKIQ